MKKVYNMDVPLCKIIETEIKYINYEQSEEILKEFELPLDLIRLFHTSGNTLIFYSDYEVEPKELSVHVNDNCHSEIFKLHNNYKCTSFKSKIHYHTMHAITHKDELQRVDILEDNKDNKGLGIIKIHDHEYNSDNHDQDIVAMFDPSIISSLKPSCYHSGTQIDIDLYNGTIFTYLPYQSHYSNNIFTGYNYDPVQGYLFSGLPHGTLSTYDSKYPAPANQSGYLINGPLAYLICTNKVKITSLSDGTFITYGNKYDTNGYPCKLAPNILFLEMNKAESLDYSLKIADKSTQTDSELNFDIDASQSFSLMQDSITQKSIAIKECVDEFNNKLGNIMSSFQELQVSDSSFQMAAIIEQSNIIEQQLNVLGDNSNIDFL